MKLEYIVQTGDNKEFKIKELSGGSIEDLIASVFKSDEVKVVTTGENITITSVVGNEGFTSVTEELDGITSSGQINLKAKSVSIDGDSTIDITDGGIKISNAMFDDAHLDTLDNPHKTYGKALEHNVLSGLIGRVEESLKTSRENVHKWSSLYDRYSDIEIREELLLETGRCLAFEKLLETLNKL